MNANWQEGMVSVIVPVYNVEKYLKRCVDSLLMQSYKNIEILLINDGSKDSSGKIADSYARNCQKIKVIHKENEGLSSARNRGLREAQGEYIAFVDSDDYIEYHMISEMVQEMAAHQAAIAVCGRTDEYLQKSSVRFVMEKNKELSSKEALQRILTWDGMDIAACDKVYRHDLWNGLTFPEGKNNEDMCVIPILIAKAGRVVHIAKPYYHYCHREESITTSYNIKKIKDFYDALACISCFIKQNYPGLRKELTYYKNHSYLALLLMAARMNWRGYQTKKADMYLQKHWRNRYSLKKISVKERVIYIMYRMNILSVVVKIHDKVKIMPQSGGRMHVSKYEKNIKKH